MNADIVSQMRAEEADLLRKLQAVREFLTAYGGAPEKSAPVREAMPPQGKRPKVAITSFTESTRTSVALALMFMATSEGLVKTSDLVTGIEAMGHKISGSNKVNALGALLARSEDVDGHGKSGWTVHNREHALSLARKYASRFLEPESKKENEPESNYAPGSDAGERKVASFPSPWLKPSDQSAVS